MDPDQCRGSTCWQLCLHEPNQPVSARGNEHQKVTTATAEEKCNLYYNNNMYVCVHVVGPKADICTRSQTHNSKEATSTGDTE